MGISNLTTHIYTCTPTIVDGNHQSITDDPRVRIILHVETLDKVEYHLDERVALGRKERGHDVRQSLDGALHLWDKDQLLQTLSTTVVGLHQRDERGNSSCVDLHKTNVEKSVEENIQKCRCVTISNIIRGS